MRSNKQYTRRAALALLGSGAALSAGGSAGYTNLSLHRSGTLSLNASSLSLTDKDGTDITSTQPYTVPVGTPTVTITNNTGSALDSLEIINNDTGSSELETAYGTTFDQTTANSAIINNISAGSAERIDVDNTGTTATTVTLDVVAHVSNQSMTKTVDITLPGGVEGAVDDLFKMDVGKSASIEVLGDITVDTNDTPPVADKAFAFPSDAMSDGEDTVIKMKDVPKMTDTTDAMTVSVWAKSGTPTWPSNGLPAARRDEFIIHSNGGDEGIGWYTGTGGDHNKIYNSSGSEISGYDLQNWHMYTFTQTENSYALYIDDVQIASGSKSDWSYELPANTSGNVEAGDVFFGKDSGYVPDEREFTDGKIGPASFYDRVLSESEVSNLFSNGSP